jgi:methionine sulfoxide reductase heme-binding subunit
MAARPKARRQPQTPAAWLVANWLSLLVHLGATLPLAWLVWRAIRGDLGVDPVATLNNFTGRGSILLLALSLTTTPLYILFDLRKPLTVRRALGLYAFLYAALHFANFIGLDYAFDLSLILQDAVLDKPYIIVGLLALIILLVLAITSTKGWKRRLGRGWNQLHRLVYVAAALTALHFFWQAKAAERFDPLLYGAILTALLVVRIPPIRQAIIRLRQRKAAGPVMPRQASASGLHGGRSPDSSLRSE